MEAYITYCGKKAKVCCDGNCKKAFGRNTRPKVQISDNEDDWAWLADDELGIAPVDPKTYEGGHRKPLSNFEFPNKWCVRECERCNISNPRELDKPLPVRDFIKRFYNIG